MEHGVNKAKRILSNCNSSASSSSKANSNGSGSSGSSKAAEDSQLKVKVREGFHVRGYEDLSAVYSVYVYQEQLLYGRREKCKDNLSYPSFGGQNSTRTRSRTLKEARLS